MRGWWWMRWPAIIVLVLVVLVVVLVWRVEVERSGLENKCRMTYMFPSYTALPRPQHDRYRLMVYRERGRPFTPRGRPILFIPGHLGSFEQVRSLGSLLDVAPARALGTPGFDVFAIDFQEEPSGVSGYVLAEQQDFVNDCIATINTLYRDAGVELHPLVVIGHSMGGILALSAARTTAPFAHTISTVITLAAPLAHPPLSYYPQLSRAYIPFRGHRNGVTSTCHSNTLPSPPLASRLLPANTTALVISGGVRDRLVPSALSLPATAGDLALRTFDTTRMPNVLVSADHLCILWCNQIVRALTSAITSAEQRATAAATDSIATALREQLYYSRFSDHIHIPPISELPAAPTVLHGDSAGGPVRVAPQTLQGRRARRGSGANTIVAALRLQLLDNHLVAQQHQQHQRKWHAVLVLESKARPSTLNVSLCRPMMDAHNNHSHIDRSSTSRRSDDKESWELVSSVLSHSGSEDVTVTLDMSALRALRTVSDSTAHLATARVAVIASGEKTDGGGGLHNRGDREAGEDQMQQQLPPENTQDLHLCIATSNSLTITPSPVLHQQRVNARQGRGTARTTAPSAAAAAAATTTTDTVTDTNASDAAVIREVQPPTWLLGLVGWCYHVEVACHTQQQCTCALLAQQRFTGFGTWGSAYVDATGRSGASVAFCDEFPEATHVAPLRLLVWPEHSYSRDDGSLPHISVGVDGMKTLAQNVQRMLHVLPVSLVTFGIVILLQPLLHLLRERDKSGIKPVDGSVLPLRLEDHLVVRRAAVSAAAVTALLSALCMLDTMDNVAIALTTSTGLVSEALPMVATCLQIVSWGALVFALTNAFLRVGMGVVLLPLLRLHFALCGWLAGWLAGWLTPNTSPMTTASAPTRTFAMHTSVLLVLLLFPTAGWLLALLLLLLPPRPGDGDATWTARLYTLTLAGWVSLAPALLEDGAHSLWRLRHMQAPVPRLFWTDAFHALVLFAWLLATAIRTRPFAKPKRL